MRKLMLTLLAFSVAMPIHSQQRAQKPAPARSRRSPTAKTRGAALVPLTPEQRAQQLLNRFTFGPRPGDLEHVVSMTPEAWFEQQLNPDSIPDEALKQRLNDYLTLNLQPGQALQLFPDRSVIQQVVNGKRPYPTDPNIAAVYQVQAYRLNEDRDVKKASTDAKAAVTASTEAESDERKKTDQATAARIAGELFALPKSQRMSALIKLPVPDRIAFTSYIAGDQKKLLLAEFTPREREVFYGMADKAGSSYQIISELSQAKILRAILSERQLQEVMTDFWFNHFNVDIGKGPDKWYTTSYERDAIRKHALGKFRDLLVATATSPAMMVYLDNGQSIGPNSLANGVNPANPTAKKGNRGLNENYGREVMELHTVGVNGGYTQADVTALSAILTGWTVERPGQGGPFQFDSRKHEPGPKLWLGHSIDEAGEVTSISGVSHPPSTTSSAAPATPESIKQGTAAMTLLAASPSTAHFISYKLAQRFVADDPPPALVDRMAATYLSTDGDIKAILRTLVQSPEFNSTKYFRNKVKTPMEFLASAFRATATEPANPGALVTTMKTMGMPLYYALPPTGYAITADHWMNSTALVDRLNFAYVLTGSKFANQRFDSSRVLALGLMAQPAHLAASASTSGHRPKDFPRYSNAALTTTVDTQSSPDSSGQEIALRVLESTLVGGGVSIQTDRLIHQQMADLPAATSTDILNLLTALIIGSPEFQLR